MHTYQYWYSINQANIERIVILLTIVMIIIMIMMMRIIMITIIMMMIIIMMMMMIMIMMMIMMMMMMVMMTIMIIWDTIPLMWHHYVYMLSRTTYIHHNYTKQSAVTTGFAFYTSAWAKSVLKLGEKLRAFYLFSRTYITECAFRNF